MIQTPDPVWRLVRPQPYTIAHGTRQLIGYLNQVLDPESESEGARLETQFCEMLQEQTFVSEQNGKMELRSQIQKACEAHCVQAALLDSPPSEYMPAPRSWDTGQIRQRSWHWQTSGLPGSTRTSRKALHSSHGAANDP